MKSMRLPLITIMGIALVGIILGSIFDYELSKAIASPTNTFGLVVSVISPTIGFCGVSIIGGGFIALARKDYYKTLFKVLFAIAAVGCLIVGIVFAGGEFFGPNGFYWVAPKWVGYFIPVLPLAAAEYLGYRLFKENEFKNLWIIFLIALGVLLVSYVVILTPLKNIMHRPRFRSVVGSDIPYHNWWERCSNYKELMEANNLTSEEFKSYPSGHTVMACVVLIPVVLVMPYMQEKYRKYQLPLFICGFLFIVLLAFSRILAAAHYLSDVSTGALIAFICIYIANEVLIRVKALQVENK